MYTALSQGILAFKLERICKFPQHMVLYRGISHPQNRTSVEMNCISRRFLLARTCPTHPTNLQSLGDKKHWSTTEDTTWDFAALSAKPLFPLACRRQQPGPMHATLQWHLPAVATPSCIHLDTSIHSFSIAPNL